VEKEKKLIFAEKSKKENLPNFKNPKPFTEVQSYYILKYFADSSFNSSNESLKNSFAKNYY